MSNSRSLTAALKRIMICLQVIEEASEKGLVKLPEKSFQRPPNANDTPEGWPAYCFFIGWLLTLLFIAGMKFFLPV